MKTFSLAREIPQKREKNIRISLSFLVSWGGFTRSVSEVRARFVLSLSSFFLVRWFITRRDCATERERERERERFKHIVIFKIVPVGCCWFENKDEFYLEHAHHFKFVDEYYE